jgi:hypothetical protein
VSAKGVPALHNAYLIVMENTSQSNIVGSASATYINNTLMKKYVSTTNYSTSLHPSLPNYLDIVSGSAQGVGSDCSVTGLLSCGGITAKHFGDFLDTAGVSWREYAEGMGTACNVGNSGSYATKHVPFLYFADVQTNATTCADKVVDYSVFTQTDINAPRRFSMISPNLCNDMHDSCAPTNDPIKQGDTWLSTNADAIIKKLGPTDAVFIVWDEQTGSTGGAGTPMMLIIASPLIKTPGGTTAKAYTHESLLATFEQAFGTPQTLGGTGTSTPINDVWK